MIKLAALAAGLNSEPLFNIHMINLSVNVGNCRFSVKHEKRSVTDLDTQIDFDLGLGHERKQLSSRKQGGRLLGTRSCSNTDHHGLQCQVHFLPQW